MRIKLALLILAGSLATTTLAHADYLVSGTSDGGDFFSLNLTVTPAGAGMYDITAATGTVNNLGVTLLPDTNGLGNPFLSPSGDFVADNILLVPGYPFDFFGILLTDGSDELDIYGDTPGIASSTGYSANVISYSVTPTPEPSSLVLLGTGILTAAGAARRRIQRS